MKTIEDLKERRADLVERRMVEVFWLHKYDDERMAKVANIQTAIAALDAVIALGDVPPERGYGSIISTM